MNNQRLIDRLRAFASAYPEDIFPPLTHEERAALPYGIVDRISAGMGRHLSQIMGEAADALSRKEQP